ncbi:MAG: PilN domain-containing protein, partial [Thermoanaerobaculia bacterium]
PNLARAPFVNERPVRRLAVTLWVLFALVGGLAVWQSRASRQQSTTRLAELVRLNSEIVSARERAATLERELRSANLPAQNERTEFLNRRLAERSFSWSSLLESLTAVMPRGVRLVRLSPDGFASDRRRGGASPRTAAATHVAIRISGEAEETEALLEFVDRLFQNPAFDRPSLSRESEKKDLKIQFELTVAYLPEVAGQLAAGTTGATPAAPATGARSAASGLQAGGLSGSSNASALAPSTLAADVAATGRPRPASGAATGASVWGDGRAAGGDEKAETDVRGRSAVTTPAGGGRLSGVPAGGVPAMGGTAGGGFRPQSAVPPGAAPSAAGGGRFPDNVMPTPLRPYASSTGGGR